MQFLNDYTYDIETYPNTFTLTIEHCHSPEFRQYEISNRRNDYTSLIELVNWLRTQPGCRLVGYNNEHFDYPILHQIILTPGITAEAIYSIVCSIFAGENRYRVWPNDCFIPQVDLFKIHHFDNKAKRTRLKDLEFNMRSRNISDLPFPPGTVLLPHQIDTLLRYNHDDVRETKAFYHHSLPAIEFRAELSKKYGKDVTNFNDTKIGKDYLISEIEKAVPGTCYEFGTRTPRQTWRHEIVIADCIFPYVRFERPEFQAVLGWLKRQVISTTKGVFNDIPETELGELAQYAKLRDKKSPADALLPDDRFNRYTQTKSSGKVWRHYKQADNLNCIIDGFKFDFGTGGLHGSVESQTVCSDEQYEIVDLDVASYYPNLGIVNRIYPQHLGQIFCDKYLEIYQERKKLKAAGQDAAQQMMKLALNGSYGDSNSQYSPLYDPVYTMSITVNGQLLLCMLAEQLIKIPGLKIIQVNTDGITVRQPRNQRPTLKAICEWWQQYTLLQLEGAVYSRMFIRDVNNYIAVYSHEIGADFITDKPVKSKIKRKGAYAWKFDPVAGINKGLGDLEWHQDHSALVIPKAAEMALVHGQDIGGFIMTQIDPFDFMIKAKVGGDTRLILRERGVDTPQQNVTRYYVSRSGGSLIALYPREIGLCVGWNVTECNNADKFDWSNLDYEYYIAETEKLVKPVKSVI